MSKADQALCPCGAQATKSTPSGTRCFEHLGWSLREIERAERTGTTPADDAKNPEQWYCTYRDCGDPATHFDPATGPRCAQHHAGRIGADRPAMPSCGHSACRQNWIDTGHNGCIQLWACQVCGCTDVQETAWISMNTGEPDGGEGPLEQHWCPECCDHTEVDRTATELQEVK